MPSGFFVTGAGQAIDPKVVDQATEIFAFDALTLNPDRRVDNPNCQYNGKNFAIYDHDLSLMATGIGGLLNPAPWQPGGLARLCQGASEHPFYRSLKGKPGTLDRLEAAWKALPDNRVTEYVNALPVSWQPEGEIAQESAQYIVTLQGHLTEAFAEVRRTLT